MTVQGRVGGEFRDESAGKVQCTYSVMIMHVPCVVYGESCPELDPVSFTCVPVWNGVTGVTVRAGEPSCGVCLTAGRPSFSLGDVVTLSPGRGVAASISVCQASSTTSGSALSS